MIRIINNKKNSTFIDSVNLLYTSVFPYSAVS